MTEIKDYITNDYKAIDSLETIAVVQDFFAEVPFSHFPVIEESIYIGSIAAEDALHLLVLGLLLFDLLAQRLQFRTPGTDGHLIGDVGHQHTQQQQNEEKTKDRPHKRAASALFPGGICHFSAPPVLSRPETPVLLL